MTSDPLNPVNCACFNVRRAARGLTRIYDQALKPAGLHATQFTLLSVLAGSAGDAKGEDGITMTGLAQRLGTDRTTLTRNLALAERAGWIATRPGADRRERLIAPTAAGRDVLRAALPHWKAAQERILAQLGPSGLNDLLALTHRLHMD